MPNIWEILKNLSIFTCENNIRFESMIFFKLYFLDIWKYIYNNELTEIREFSDTLDGIVLWETERVDGFFKDIS